MYMKKLYNITVKITHLFVTIVDQMVIKHRKLCVSDILSAFSSPE